ncbi:unnamed protein product [Cylindrotheca closterium]|uniref:Pre-mRNA processing factor 4 (PRP4)-like domain-containing protein n=1 Tax=Cylindrotheca closterium TaxID=2856 RepID=A0AAD2CPB3_9STRA|nr:unnamed protein product [Cylindrotheca closterium]
MANRQGNSNYAQQVEVMELTEASQLDRQKHQHVLLEIEAKKRAFQVDVPTLPNDVRMALRTLGLPVRLFGENLANVRDRLRMELAKREVLKEQGGTIDDSLDDGQQEQKAEAEEEQVTKYSRATPQLIKARELITKYSMKRAKERLDMERKFRLQVQRKKSKLASLPGPEGSEVKEEDYAEMERLDEACVAKYKTLRTYGLGGSQYGDARPISSICTSLQPHYGVPLVATGSWSGTIKLWNGSSLELNQVGEKTMAHEDRIMGVAIHQQSNTSSAILATASIDLTAKLWKIHQSSSSDDSMAVDGGEDAASKFTLEEAVVLKGHATRLSKVAFHPMGQHVGTTSFDHTWRLWDVETGSEVLLQDGHWKEVYGIGFHKDGSLCSTTDFGGVVQVWDIRTGKSICHFLGHANRVLCSEFSSNGFQLATAGDDGTLKVWDLRRRKQFASVPAHSGLITQIQFDRHDNGEYLASSSFDGTVKMWSTRDWKMLSTLRGHEGKVMGLGLFHDSIVSCGFDKTLKLWQ